MGSFGSTPIFKLFQRGLTVNTIQRFRGLNALVPLTRLGPEWAQDLLNVIIGSDGGIHKFRQPIQLSPPGAIPAGPQQLFDFQQANGVRQIFTNIGTRLAYYTNNGTVGPAFVGANDPSNAGPWSFVEVGNLLIGGNGQKLVKWTGTDLLGLGLPAPAAAPIVAIQGGGNISPVTGYEWAFSWKSSGNAPGLNGPSPIEVGTASPATAQLDGGGANHKYLVTAAQPPNPIPLDYDTLVFWRTLDGGGDLFRLAEMNVNTGVVTFNAATVVPSGVFPFISIVDNTPDTALDETTRAPFLNAQPIIGKYLAVGQGRVLIMNLAGAPQDAIYSGYERILVGNPPECYPPNNRLRLSIGAEAIAGGGFIQPGAVLFSNTDRMYMFRGQIEDITDTAPVQFTQYLEELPWTLGLLSHDTVKATPYGLLWVAADKTVQLFDGHSEPQDLSAPVYPILRNITVGAEAAIRSAYFNWLDRDWYVLLVPYGGSVTPNRMIFWALNKQTSEIDVFISTIAADGIGTITTSTLQRQLIIGLKGQLLQLPTAQDTTGGIGDLTIYPAQANVQIPAYWRSGYFGNEQPYRSSMWRWARLQADQGGFEATIRMVDDDLRTIIAPEVLGPLKFAGRVGINRRAKRCSIEINFPVQDVSSNVLELQVAYLPSSDR